MHDSQRTATPTTPPDYRSAARVVTMVFFMLGFITALNDILIPHLRYAFTLSYAQGMLIQSTFFGAYFVMSIPAGRVVAWVGYKGALIVGLTISAVGTCLFFPAAGLQSYGLFLAALFVLATGITVQQVAFNPYMSLLGSARTASSRMSLAHAFNSLGTTLAPLFGGFLILSATVLSVDDLSRMSAAQVQAYRVAEAHAVQWPYVGLAVALMLVAAVLMCWRMPRFNERTKDAQHTDVQRASLIAPLQYRHMRLAVGAIFVYVGAEVSIGSFMVNYLEQPDIGGLTATRAAYFLSFYWGGAMVGRFVGAFLLRFIAPGRLLGIAALCAGALVGLSVAFTGAVAMWSIIAVGLFNAIMFPTIFSLGIVGLRHMTAQASSLISMAIVGGAVVPVLQGLLADHVGIQWSFLLPMCCYGFILFYSWSGSRPVPLVPAASAVTPLARGHALR